MFEWVILREMDLTVAPGLCVKRQWGVSVEKCVSLCWVEGRHLGKGLGTRCNFLTSATSALPQVAIQIAVLAAHVATLNRSPRNPIPNKENSCGTIHDFSFAQAMGHRVIRNAAL